MKTAVRYFSRSGNTKAVAEAIAQAAEVEAISVDAQEAVITEPVDVLFLGGALYKYGIDDHMKAYLETLDKEMIGKVAVFSTSWFSKHAIDLIKDGAAKKGIEVVSESLYVRGKPNDAQKVKAAEYAKKLI
ncbi:MAG: flavodoxin [Lachnospiraceae bacterium]|nr:flavodoxin [Lachnospiraceae bacterium]